jgi:antitoxin CptB|tara:strand:- start:116 stop:376 length:261 start_codon:yes stop_codon:yes gene_type:complete
MSETNEHRLKRLRMRSWRRGLKEMDLILGSYSDHKLADLDEDTTVVYDALLSENDQDLYAWVTGQTPTPPRFEALISIIKEHANTL